MRQTPDNTPNKLMPPIKEIKTFTHKYIYSGFCCRTMWCWDFWAGVVNIFLDLYPTLLSKLNTPVFTVCMKHCNEPFSHFSSGFDPKDLLSVSLCLSA